MDAILIGLSISANVGQGRFNIDNRLCMGFPFRRKQNKRRLMHFVHQKI